MESLYKKLEDYCKGNLYPFHMPGHKRNLKLFDKAYSADITEIDGFDDLHHASGILQEAMDEMAHIYGSDKSYILVNGSTCGILSAISACTALGDKILIARNCHKSVYNALLLRALKPVYLYPEVDDDFGLCKSVNPKDVRKALENNKDIKAVVITSPTYEGVVSDIESIASVAHSFNVPLIVDEAHGAHFSFGNVFPKSAVRCGADIVIQSLHKTLPSLTQTAILHVKSDLLSPSDVQKYLRIYQTSSPSYILMGSAIECVKYMQENGANLTASFYSRLTALRDNVKKLSNVHLYGDDKSVFDYDISKLVFSVNGYSGLELMSVLRQKYELELEMAAGNYVIAMTSVCDTGEGFERLCSALQEVTGVSAKQQSLPAVPDYFIKTEYVMSPYEASLRDSEYKPYNDAVNLISAETLYIYPPGIPLIVAGERIDADMIDVIERFELQGFTVHSDTRNSHFIKCLI